MLSCLLTALMPLPQVSPQIPPPIPLPAPGAVPQNHAGAIVLPLLLDFEIMQKRIPAPEFAQLELVEVRKVGSPVWREGLRTEFPIATFWSAAAEVSEPGDLLVRVVRVVATADASRAAGKLSTLRGIKNARLDGAGVISVWLAEGAGALAPADLEMLLQEDGLELLDIVDPRVDPRVEMRGVAAKVRAELSPRVRADASVRRERSPTTDRLRFLRALQALRKHIVDPKASEREVAFDPRLDEVFECLDVHLDLQTAKGHEARLAETDSVSVFALLRSPEFEFMQLDAQPQFLWLPGMVDPVFERQPFLEEVERVEHRAFGHYWRTFADIALDAKRVVERTRGDSAQLATHRHYLNLFEAASSLARIASNLSDS